MTTWNKIINNAEFPDRDSARLFRMGGRLYISNGYVYGDGERRDLYSTTDALHWSVVNAATPYEAYSAIIPLGAVLYAYLTEMWKSLDGGLNWTKILDEIPFAVSAESPCLELNGNIIHINHDGTWEYHEKENAWVWIGGPPLGRQRTSPNAVQFKGAVYLIGGRDESTPNVPPEAGYTGYTTYNDVWRSEDGCRTWELVTEDMPLQPRMWPTVSVLQDQLYMMGGWDNIHSARNLTDTYSSKDGKDWRRVLCDQEFTERHAPVSFVWNGELYIMAGNSSPNPSQTLNDIWKLTP